MDDALAKIGRISFTAMYSSRFAVMSFVIHSAPLIATMHATLARFFSESMGPAVRPPPNTLPDVPISMFWRASNDAVPGPRLLRETFMGLRLGEGASRAVG